MENKKKSSQRLIEPCLQFLAWNRSLHAQRRERRQAKQKAKEERTAREVNKAKEEKKAKEVKKAKETKKAKDEMKVKKKKDKAAHRYWEPWLYAFRSKNEESIKALRKFIESKEKENPYALDEIYRRHSSQRCVDDLTDEYLSSRQNLGDMELFSQTYRSLYEETHVPVQGIGITRVFTPIYI